MTGAYEPTTLVTLLELEQPWRLSRRESPAASTRTHFMEGRSSFLGDTAVVDGTLPICAVPRQRQAPGARARGGCGRGGRGGCGWDAPAQRYCCSASFRTSRKRSGLSHFLSDSRTDSSLSSRDTLASAFTWGPRRFSGETRRMKRFAGSPSIESKSMPSVETPQEATSRSRRRVFPCGIATPFPIPVDI